MRYLCVLLFAVLASQIARAGNDSTEVCTWNNRYILHMTATSALEPGFAKGYSHVAPGFEYTHYYSIGGIGWMGIGAKISNTFVEQYPLNIPTRIEETWLEIPIRLNVGGENSDEKIMGSDVGVYVGGLLKQSIHEQPGSVLPEDVKKGVGVLGYYRFGVLVDFTIPVIEMPQGAVMLGFTFRSDMATFGEPSDRGLTAKQTSVGLYFGVAF